MRELASSFAAAAAASASSSSSASAAAAALRGWWDDVNESPDWQHAAFFSLAAAYALVSAVALVRSLSPPPPSLPRLAGRGGARHGTAEGRSAPAPAPPKFPFFS